MKSKYRSLMASECVHLSPKRCSSEVVSWGMRVELSEMGLSSKLSTVQPPHFLITASMARALNRAMAYCESVKITTPALPLESATTQEAAVSDTSAGRVVTLANRPAPGLGPGCSPECQPTRGIPALAAASKATFCSDVSKPPTTMPAGLSASAWFSAAVRPLTEPWPSMTRTVQPITLPASSTPCEVPRWPPFFRSPAT